MENSFTERNYDALWEWDTESDNIECISKAIKYLNDPNSFRTFSEGLIELLARAGYKGEKDVKSMSCFVIDKLQTIGAEITPATVKSWFEGTRTPDSKSRENMFKLCFALNLSLEDLSWFFQHVYFEKSFNCHTIKEAVLYFCFKNKKTYHDSVRLTKIIETYHVQENYPNGRVYTSEIRQRIDSLTTEEEFLLFMKEMKPLFSSWNIKAKEYIEQLKNEIIKPDGLIDKELKKESDTYKCQESDTKYKSIRSNDFMLEGILFTHDGLPKKSDVPPIVKTNFPNKKYLSNILTSETATSYDAIKKLLSILKFYQFWCKVALGEIPDNGDLFGDFLDDLNEILNDCGYAKLIASNPFDWLIMRAASDEKPIEFLRVFIYDITNEE